MDSEIKGFNFTPQPKKAVAMMPPKPLPNLPLNARMTKKYELVFDERKNIGDKIKCLDCSNIEKSKLYANHLDSQIEDIIEMIINTVPFTIIAAFYGVPTAVFFNWRLHSEHSARIEEMLEYSAEIDAYMAGEILDEPVDGDMAKANLLREKSQYLRWRAAVRMPKRFGKNIQEKLEVNINNGVENKTDFEGMMAELKRRKQLGTDKNSHIEDAEITGTTIN